MIAVPQALRLLRVRSSAGVSLLIWQTTVVASVCWTAHGLINGVVQIFLPNAIFAATAVIVVAQLQRMRRLAPVRVWILPSVWTTAAVGVDLAFGPYVFAAAQFIPTAVGLVSQLREILRADDVRGVSMTGLAVNLLSQALWLAYAIPAGEVAVTGVGVPAGLLMVGTMVTLLVRRRQTAPGTRTFG